MELKIRKWGSGVAVRLPAALLEHIDVSVGDPLHADIHPEGILLTPVRRKYSLGQLVAQRDSQAPLPADLASWGAVMPNGHEVW
ncbi:AbrB/MazE/SpoVT family DNA-binding domain-containing protein [Trinickia sp. NRRL B-1857]|uniref:AbrB/MazE/SpoVT family DNA-binding domain-containing protein n=1 Tax=Trinickia sp. NRRL B-1857 TaxID=3162879 RepID=UPI003D28B82F